MTIKSKTIFKLRHLQDKSVNRSPRILSKDQATAAQQASHSKSLSFIHDARTNAIAFTSTHGYVELPSEFVPVTTYPKNGLVRTVEDILTSHPGATALESVEELAAHLDKFYPWYGHVKDSETPNWQPEHFPEGTVVELANFCLDNNDEWHVGSPKNRSERKPAIFTVDSIVKIGVNSHVIVTTNFSRHLGGMFDSFNFHHIGRIIKRGNGKVNLISNGNGARDEKNNLCSGLLKKSHYYWTDSRQLFNHIVKLMPSYRNAQFNNRLIYQLNSQTFVKKYLIDDFYEVLHADKKKFREYVRKNVNRWLLTAKEAEQAQREDDEESNRQYYEDMENLYEGDLHSIKVLTPGANEFNVGLPSDEQTQSDVAYLASKGNAKGH